MERVTDLADPRRCKASVGTGQCMTVAEEGSDYCRVHAGSYQPPEKGLRQYLWRKAQDRARLAAFAEHDDIKSLRDEIALTRMMVEGLWNSAQSDAERLAVYGRVNSHILTLESWSRRAIRSKSGWAVCWQSRRSCVSGSRYARSSWLASKACPITSSLWTR